VLSRISGSFRPAKRAIFSQQFLLLYTRLVYRPTKGAGPISVLNWFCVPTVALGYPDWPLSPFTGPVPRETILIRRLANFLRKRGFMRKPLTNPSPAKIMAAE
jgi:hypothetical protein